MTLQTSLNRHCQLTELAPLTKHRHFHFCCMVRRPTQCHHKTTSVASQNVVWVEAI